RELERGAPYQLKNRSVRRVGQPPRDASRVGEAHFLGIDRRALCLLGIGTLQLVSGCASIPEVSAKERALCLVEIEYGESGGVRVSLCCPLAGPEVKRSGIRDHRQIDRRDRSAKAGVRHVAESA